MRLKERKRETVRGGGGEKGEGGREKSGDTGVKFAITAQCNVEKCSGNYSQDNNERAS